MQTLEMHHVYSFFRKGIIQVTRQHMDATWRSAMNEDVVTIYTDGSCWVKTGDGGYAAIVMNCSGEVIEINGGMRKTLQITR